MIVACAQCLAHEPILVEYLLSGRYKDHLNTANGLGTGGVVTSALADLFKEMWNNKWVVVNPGAFRSAAARFNPDWQWNGQQDSHEFLQWLLDKVHEDLNQADTLARSPSAESFRLRDRGSSAAASAAARGPSTPHAARTAWMAHTKRNSSVVVDRYTAQLAHSLTCPECKHESVSFSSELCVPVTVPPSYTSYFVAVIKEIRPVDAFRNLRDVWPRLVRIDMHERSALELLRSTELLLEEASPPAGHPGCADRLSSPVTVVHIRAPSHATVEELISRVRRSLSLPESSVAVAAWRRHADCDPQMIPSGELVGNPGMLLLSCHAKRPKPGSPSAEEWGRPQTRRSPRLDKATPASVHFDIRESDEVPGRIIWIESNRFQIIRRMDWRASAVAALRASGSVRCGDVYKDQKVILNGLPYPYFAAPGDKCSALFFVAYEWARLCFAIAPDAETAEADRQYFPEGLRQSSILPESPHQQLELIPLAQALDSKYNVLGPLEPRPDLELGDSSATQICVVDLDWIPVDQETHSQVEALGPEVDALIHDVMEQSRADAQAALTQRERWEEQLAEAKEKLEAAEASEAKTVLELGYRALLDSEVPEPPASDPEVLMLRAIERLPATIEQKLMSCVTLKPPFNVVQLDTMAREHEARERGFRNAREMDEWDTAQRPGEPVSTPLSSCLSLFTQEETLEDKWKCPECHRSVRARKKLQWWNLPDVLILPLKRFQQVGSRGFSRKNSMPVRYPLELDMREWLASDAKEPVDVGTFSLFAVASHYGSLHDGHYTAKARSALSGRWFELDDSRVHPVHVDRHDELHAKTLKGEALTEQEERANARLEAVRVEDAVQDQFAYVLFYQRQGALSAGGGADPETLSEHALASVVSQEHDPLVQITRRQAPATE
jgi:ubiquitin C-terminal hydrolase